MLEIVGLGSHPFLALDFEQTYWSAFLRECRLFDGVIEFLEELRLASVTCACLTDLTAQIQFRKLTYWRLDHYLQVLVISEEVGEEKPARAGFDMVLEKCAEKPETIWMIGDELDRDIEGAKNAIDAVTFLKVLDPAAADRDAIAADVVFDDFAALTKTFVQTSSERGCRVAI